MVYSDTTQLKHVANIWGDYREQFLKTGILVKGMREEGVILKEFRVGNKG